MFSSTIEQFYYGYQYDPKVTFNYSTNDLSNDTIQYQTQSSLICPQEEIISTNKIYFNPFFKPRSLNSISESSSQKSRSRSPPSDRKVTISPNKNPPARQIRKEQRAKLIEEKELLCKRQSALIMKHKRRCSSSDRREHKEEKLKRLYKEYSDEETYKQWKPLLLKECFELYQYAFDKYHGKSNDN